MKPLANTLATFARRSAFQMIATDSAFYGEVTLSLCRQFFQSYPVLPGDELCYALRNESAEVRHGTSILYAVRKESSLASDSTTSLVPSRYQLHLPSEDDLAAELRRELALLAPPKIAPAKRAPKRSAP